MANAREIKSRISSVQDTMKITNAMYMISSSKMKKAKKENYRIVTESGKQLFNQNYTEAGANRIWEMYNGIYTDDNGNQEYIYIEKI